MEGAPRPDHDAHVEPEAPIDAPAGDLNERRRLPVPEFFGRRAFRSKNPARRDSFRKGGKVQKPKNSTASSGNGLLLAEQELARLTELHAAYATQPNLSPGWQHHLDDKAEAIAKQRGEVDRLRAVVRAELQAKADAAAQRVEVL